MLAGELSPREFTFRIHQHHGHELVLTERLAELDDEYDTLENGDRTAAQIDAEVTAEARRLAAHPYIPAEPTDTQSDAHRSTREFPPDRLQFDSTHRTPGM